MKKLKPINAALQFLSRYVQKGAPNNQYFTKKALFIYMDEHGVKINEFDKCLILLNLETAHFIEYDEHCDAFHVDIGSSLVCEILKKYIVY